jgi:hypothetical protein
MFGLIPLLVIVVLILIFGGFYSWAKRRGLLTAGPAAEVAPGKRRISLLTEAVAYIGAILILAGGAAAIGQHWDSLGGWGHVGVYAGAAVFFLLVGIAVRNVREPALQRLVGVTWFISAAGVAGAAGFMMSDVIGNQDAVLLTIGVAVTLYSAVLWLIRRSALQNVALFWGLVVTIIGAISMVGHAAPSLAYAIALWAFGLAWAGLGWRRFIEPMWVTVPCGAVLALIAPSVAAGEYGLVYAIGIATAAAAMALSVPLRNTPLLAVGTLAMFGYVTAMVVQYFHRSLGVPAALAITGVLVIGLALVSARLMRVTRPPAAKEPGADEPPAAKEAGADEPAPAAQAPQPGEPGTKEPSHRDLPKAS